MVEIKIILCVILFAFKHIENQNIETICNESKLKPDILTIDSVLEMSREKLYIFSNDSILTISRPSTTKFIIQNVSHIRDFFKNGNEVKGPISVSYIGKDKLDQNIIVLINSDYVKLGLKNSRKIYWVVTADNQVRVMNETSFTAIDENTVEIIRYNDTNGYRIYKQQTQLFVKRYNNVKNNAIELENNTYKLVVVNKTSIGIMETKGIQNDMKPFDKLKEYDITAAHIQQEQWILFAYNKYFCRLNNVELPSIIPKCDIREVSELFECEVTAKPTTTITSSATSSITYETETYNTDNVNTDKPKLNIPLYIMIGLLILLAIIVIVFFIVISKNKNTKGKHFDDFKVHKSKRKTSFHKMTQTEPVFVEPKQEVVIQQSEAFISSGKDISRPIPINRHNTNESSTLSLHAPKELSLRTRHN